MKSNEVSRSQLSKRTRLHYTGEADDLQEP